jgi:hypothetical protein
MLTAKDVQEYQAKLDTVKTIGEFKALGRELRDKFNLTDRQAIDILIRNNSEVIKILANQD